MAGDRLDVISYEHKKLRILRILIFFCSGPGMSFSFND